MFLFHTLYNLCFFYCCVPLITLQNNHTNLLQIIIFVYSFWSFGDCYHTLFAHNIGVFVVVEWLMVLVVSVNVRNMHLVQLRYHARTDMCLFFPYSISFTRYSIKRRTTPRNLYILYKMQHFSFWIVFYVRSHHFL